MITPRDKLLSLLVPKVWRLINSQRSRRLSSKPSRMLKRMELTKSFLIRLFTKLNLLQRKLSSTLVSCTSQIWFHMLYTMVIPSLSSRSMSTQIRSEKTLRREISLKTYLRSICWRTTIFWNCFTHQMTRRQTEMKLLSASISKLWSRHLQRMKSRPLYRRPWNLRDTRRPYSITMSSQVSP